MSCGNFQVGAYFSLLVRSSEANVVETTKQRTHHHTRQNIRPPSSSRIPVQVYRAFAHNGGIVYSVKVRAWKVKRAHTHTHIHTHTHMYNTALLVQARTLYATIALFRSSCRYLWLMEGSSLRATSLLVSVNTVMVSTSCRAPILREGGVVWLA